MPKPISEEKKLDWKTKILEQQKSGLSINQWCLRNGITKTAFYYWKEKLFPKKLLSPSDFTELTLEKNTGISIEYQGMKILVEKFFDPTTLQSCIAALRKI
jgi:hypothetical protein